MPSLEEYYARAVELYGEDSLSAKSLKQQIDNAKYNAGRSFQQLLEDGPNIHEIFDDVEDD